MPRHVTALLLSTCASLGCAPDAVEATWEVQFASPDLGARAARVDAVVRRGGCNSTVEVYRATFDPDEGGPDLPALDPGTYGFAAQATDEQCVVFAEGCLEVELPPSDTSLRVVLDERTQTRACPAVACVRGICAEVPDAGGAMDAGSDGGVDGGVDAGFDAGDLDAGPYDAGDPTMDAGRPDAGRPDAGFDAGPPGPPYVPSNVPRDLFWAGTASVVLSPTDGTVIVDTDTGAITRRSDSADLRPAGVVHRLVPQLGGAPDLGAFAVEDFVVPEGVTVQVQGRAALVIAASGAVTLDGVIDARGGLRSPDNGGAGGYDGGTSLSRSGAGPGGGLSEMGLQDVGGGGGGHLASGGRGGARALAVAPAGGSSNGVPALVPLIGGSGGGFGGGGEYAGVGGGGGGAVQISAGTITVGPLGGVNAGGGGGFGGDEDDGGGGGGAGGAILLEAVRVEIDGAVAANGGGGGAGADRADEGRAGQAGRLSATAAVGGATTGEGSAGGRGGASGAPAGAPGADTAGTGMDDNAGGGGGSGGRIRINAGSSRIDGAVSPAEGLTMGAL